MKRFLLAPSAVLALAFGLFTGPTSWAKPADLPSNNQIECPDGSDDPMPRKFSIELGLDLFSKRVTVKVESDAAKPETLPNIDTVLPAYVEQLFKLVGDAVVQASRERTDKQAADRAEKARTVETRLFDPVNVKIKDVPFKQAIKNLAYASGIRIVVDHRAMKEARIDLDRPVSLVLENTSAHTALQQLLAPMRLSYVIENEIVKITPKEFPFNPAQAKIEQAQRMFEIGEKCRRAGEYEKARTCYQRAHLLAPTTLQGRVAITRLSEIEERLRDAAEEADHSDRQPDPDPEQTYRDMLERTIPLGLVEVSY